MAPGSPQSFGFPLVKDASPTHASPSMHGSISESVRRPSIATLPRSSAEFSRSSAEFSPGEVGSSNQEFWRHTTTFRIMVIGSLNFDHIWVLPRLVQPSETVIAEHRAAPGGKGATQAVACARLSRGRSVNNNAFRRRSSGSQEVKKFIKVSMIGAVGTDHAADEMVEALQANNVDTEYILQCQGEATGRASIAIWGNGENNVLVCPGANYRLTFDKIGVSLRKGWPHLLILQMEIPVQTVEDLIARAAKEGIPILLNAAPVMDDFPRDILRSVEHLIVNKVEAERLLERYQPASNTSWQRPAREDDRDAEIGSGTELRRSLLSKFGMKFAVVTMGSHGGVAGSRGYDNQLRIFDYEAAEVEEVVDTTGCGGVFIGAYAVQYIRQKFSQGGGFDLARAVNWAASAAAFKAKSIGSLDGIPWEDQLEAT
ncbi:hypothetical protein PV10_00089 [Exophiala mesophila]|uniref:Ribokinase n=1 Tax=Exophiala mesophila TaxID=212818 RepID=A0A0D2AB76_EXOME|nr:uncharacterized protein PV10_00089 [Exophiala mesophila]KIV96193.1 hypothetical protein PV10_00089 [Exophiala mesophila]